MFIRFACSHLPSSASTAVLQATLLGATSAGGLNIQISSRALESSRRGGGGGSSKGHEGWKRLLALDKQGAQIVSGDFNLVGLRRPKGKEQRALMMTPSTMMETETRHIGSSATTSRFYLACMASLESKARELSPSLAHLARSLALYVSLERRVVRNMGLECARPAGLACSGAIVQQGHLLPLC